MKKFVLWCPILIPVFLLISCPVATVENSYEGLEPGTFWAQNLAAQNYYRVDSVLLAEGEKCLVWAEKSSGVSVAAGKAIANEYDSKIYPKIVGIFGSGDIMESGDVDGNGKFTLLLLDIRDGFSGSGAYTAGYFFSNDVLPSNHSNIHSNYTDMIYVDTSPSKLGSPDSYATIAHELQHFINFTTRYTAEYGYSRMDTWIDEGLSAAAEYSYLERHNRERVDQFTLSETVRQGNNFFVWEYDRSDTILDEYSTVYLFFQWLRIQSGGTDIYRRIISSPHSDYRAVTGAISGTFAAELGSTDWETTLRSWLAANYINSKDGIYGYHDELPEVQVYALGGERKLLLPGEGVYSAATGDTPGSLPSGGDPNIRYAGLRKPGASQESPLSLNDLYPQGRLLTFNSNEKESRNREWGMLTDGVAEPIPSSTRTGRSAVGNSWIIDARDIWGRVDNGDE
jgi:hypothetical protein